MIATQAGVDLQGESYQADPDTYRFAYDQDTTTPSMAVVAALSEVVDADPIELDPLHDAVDTDALDVLVHGPAATNGDVSVSFPVAEYAVTIHSPGVVTITDRGRDGSDERPEGTRH